MQETYAVSETKKISEMDADELKHEYRLLLAGITGTVAVITDYDQLNLIAKCYKEITGESITKNAFKI